ncbi:MAG: hypothetical protein FJZ01_24370 [Candidatus Sericytochromatia bacterium]|nr:hypothetical protein [Candidatus Tanganyikabacteria bacterium]
MAGRFGVLAGALTAVAVLFAQPAWAIKWLIQTKGEPLIQQDGSPDQTVKVGMSPAEVERILGKPDARAAVGGKAWWYYPKRGLDVVFRGQDVVGLHVVTLPAEGYAPAEIAADRGLISASTARDAVRLFVPYKRVDSRLGTTTVFHYWDDDGVGFHFVGSRMQLAVVGSGLHVRDIEVAARASLKKRGQLMTISATASAEEEAEAIKAAKIPKAPVPDGALAGVGLGVSPLARQALAESSRARREMAAGEAERGRQRYARAARHFKTVLSIEAGNCKARKAYAQSLGVLGRDREAIPAFRFALECTARDADLWFGLGISLAQTGQRKELMRIAARIGALKPALAREFRQITHLGDEDYTLYLPEGR